MRVFAFESGNIKPARMLTIKGRVEVASRLTRVATEFAHLFYATEKPDQY